jgi:hypothetical protein
MRKFKEMKPLQQLIEDAKANGWEVDTTEYDKGSDFIYLRDMYERLKQIAVNATNGHFYVYEPFSQNQPTATHLSNELDDEAWYKEILELLYIKQ